MLDRFRLLDGGDDVAGADPVTDRDGDRHVPFGVDEGRHVGASAEERPAEFAVVVGSQSPEGPLHAIEDLAHESRAELDDQR